MNKQVFAALGLAVTAISATPVLAQNICGTYTTIKGDTLREIANVTYGSPKDYRYIFEANSGRLGRTPHVIPTGVTLDLPCRDTFVAASTPVEPDAQPIAPVEITLTEEPIIFEVMPTTPTSDAVVEVQPTTIVIITEPTPIPAATPPVGPEVAELILVGFSDNLPYSDKSLLQGGLITTLIETALLRSNAANVDRPVFVTRPERGLATSVLPENFHLSFPWLLPDCQLGEFDADIRDLCENFTFSAPIYEAQMAMFTVSNSPFKDAAEEIDLVGARVCRPAALHTYDLLEDGMIEPIISLETATDLATCFDDLQNNIVDIVSVNGLTADVYFADSGRNERIIELTDLSTVHTVHAITANDDPEGLIALDYLNTGIWDMLASGEWDSIASDYLINRLN
ncbi:MAG: transporter substrate-binding domain-containing protein [Rhodobacteraceae bacterium]|nr:transporter substrate-binding domain-containing protein [Paracoccaceae bacterium]